MHKIPTIAKPMLGAVLIINNKMKEVQINVSVSIGYVGCKVNDTISVWIDESWTEKEIEDAKLEATREWLFEQINWGWIDAS